MNETNKDKLGRDNNFNLIRVILSFLVFYCHCYALKYGKNVDVMDPISDVVGHWVGYLAVDGFFAISGFLVTGSLIRCSSFRQYIVLRAIRIYPAIIVMLMLIFCFTLLASTVGFYEYVNSRDASEFFAYNSTLLFGVKYNLPGVFYENPYPRAVNGSLWTLPYEVRFYVLIGVLWFILRRFCGKSTILSGAVLLLLLSLLVFCYKNRVYWDLYYFRFGILFCLGSLIRQFSSYLNLMRRFVIVFVIAYAVILHYQGTSVLYFLIVPFSVISVAYTRIPGLSFYNRVGDYSYGMYIYAFPIQQFVMLALPNLSVNNYVALTFVITLVFSVFSWHCIEEPFLRFKKMLVN